MTETSKFNDTWVCRNCHYFGKTENVGSAWIEVVLWCCYIVPGLIYSIWRRGKPSKNRCPKCNAPHMVPASTKIGKEILDQVLSEEDLHRMEQVETLEGQYKRYQKIFMGIIYTIGLTLLAVLIFWGIIIPSL